MTNKNEVKNLLLNSPILTGVDGIEEYTMNEVIEFFDFIDAGVEDPYKFNGENFFFSHMNGNN